MDGVRQSQFDDHLRVADEALAKATTLRGAAVVVWRFASDALGASQARIVVLDQGLRRPDLHGFDDFGVWVARSQSRAAEGIAARRFLMSTSSFAAFDGMDIPFGARAAALSSGDGQTGVAVIWTGRGQDPAELGAEDALGRLSPPVSAAVARIASVRSAVS